MLKHHLPACAVRVGDPGTQDAVADGLSDSIGQHRHILLQWRPWRRPVETAPKQLSLACEDISYVETIALERVG